jgi:VIT1/CCC1 family predicted Fe2+/Mn2+ transporter
VSVTETETVRAEPSARSTRVREAILAGHPFGPGRVRERWHTGGKGGSLRAAVFGVSDGLVSNLALILGVAGGGVSNDVVVLAGVAGLLAGAFSMAAGEYISMRAQREVFEHMLEVEAVEIEIVPDAERRELLDIYVKKGVPRDIALQLVDSLMSDPDTALEAHAREELGLDPDELGSPWGAAGSSFGTFAVGAMLPLVPYLLSSGWTAFVLAVAIGGGAMGVVGGFMAHMTDRSVAIGGMRMLSIGLLAAFVTFGIGSLFGVVAS